MISLSARFTEYGVTGGLLLFCQLPIALLAAPESLAVFLGHASTHFEALPTPIQNATSTLGTAVVVVSIFFCGLLLELIGSLAVIWEVKILKQYLNESKAWFGPTIAACEPFVQRDLDQLFDDFGDPLGRQYWSDAYRSLFFWRGEAWRLLWKGNKEFLIRFKCVSSFRRIQSVLYSHALLHVDASHLSHLAEQRHLWRVSRSISTAILIIYLECFATLPFWLMPRIRDVGIDLSTYAFPIIGATSVVAVSVFITYRSYSAYCLALFSVLYASQKSHAASVGG